MITLEEIYQGLASEFQAQTGQTAGGSSELAVRFYAVAAQIYSLYVQAEWTRRQCFPQTARRKAVKAGGTVRFYVDEAREADTRIPKDTVCMTAGGIRFLTAAEGLIPAGEGWCEVPVLAAEPGASGNVGQGTIVYMALPPTGVAACANPEALSDGQDEEGDEALRERVLATYRRLANGANRPPCPSTGWRRWRCCPGTGGWALWTSCPPPKGASPARTCWTPFRTTSTGCGRSPAT